jgi:hypothetical protein
MHCLTEKFKSFELKIRTMPSAVRVVFREKYRKTFITDIRAAVAEKNEVLARRILDEYEKIIDREIQNLN